MGLWIFYAVVLVVFCAWWKAITLIVGTKERRPLDWTPTIFPEDEPQAKRDYLSAVNQPVSQFATQGKRKQADHAATILHMRRTER